MSTTSPSTALPRRARLAGRSHLDVRARAVSAAPLAGLLLLTAALYLWGLSRNGTANQYYSAAVQAGTHSWKAFLFGSLDAGNYITVDKPPASLWAMELSTRLFGFSSFSMLLPQALEGVAAVALLYSTVRRWFSRPAALLSGLVLALTPVAALMFRFNNPDALLVLLLVAGAYCVTRAVERGQTRWIALAGAALGFAFLTKMMQAFVVLPAFALVYLVAAPVPLRRRFWQLLVGGIVLVASAGWWVALVELWPASARPYIGGSTDNSVLELVFGYNGLGRISGGSGPGGGAGFSGAAGVLRLFNAELGGQIAWLLPASVIALAAGVVRLLRRRPARTDRLLATVLLWGGWLAVTAVVYSFMSGTIHPYYTNTLAPPIAVLTGVGAALLWQQRERLMARVALSAMLVGTGVCAFVLLDRTPTWHPWLRGVVLGLSLAAALVLLVRGAVLRRTAAAVLAASALLAGLAAPAAFTLNAVASAQTGSNPSAGPASASRGGFGGTGGGSLPSGGSRPSAARVDAERRVAAERRIDAERRVDGRFARRRERFGEHHRGGPARRQRVAVHVDRGDVVGADGGRSRAVDGSVGDGDRRLHRERQRDHAGAVRAARRSRQDPLLRRRRRGAAAVARAAVPVRRRAARVAPADPAWPAVSPGRSSRGSRSTSSPRRSAV